MREQIKRAGTPGPKVIGIDEISIRKGQTYRIVVSDLDRRRAIWFGGKDRSRRAWMVLRISGREEQQKDSSGGDGYVEAIPEIDEQEGAPGRHSIR